MKRITILTIVCLLITSQFFAQKLVMESDIKQQQFGTQILYKDKNDNLLNGHYKIADRRGNFIDVRFKKGKKEGKQTNYDYKERILSEKFFKNGKVHGKYKRYSQNGQVNTQGNFANGEEDGKWEYFNDKGELKTLENYKNGKAHGKWWKKVRTNHNTDEYIDFGWFSIQLPSASEIQSTVTNSVITENYKNGQHFGKSEQKNEDGTIEWEKDYTDDINYTCKQYYANGKLAVEKTIKDNMLEGKLKRYNENEVLLLEVDFKKDQIQKGVAYYLNGNKKEVRHFAYGKQNGHFEKYSDEGIKLQEGDYKDDFKTGVWKKYDSKDGRLLSESTYKNNILNGLYKSYNEAARVDWEGNYKNGEKDGIWKRYNLAGKLKQETEYKLGREISNKDYK